MQPARVKSTPLFAAATRRQQKRIAGLVDEVEVPAGTRLIAQGGYAGEFFVIADGYATVTKDGAAVASLGPGEFFGELGLIYGPTRNATVVAATRMRLLVAGAREFNTLLDSTPTVADRVRETVEGRR